jgi:hypothetical protein
MRSHLDDQKPISENERKEMKFLRQYPADDVINFFFLPYRADNNENDHSNNRASDERRCFDTHPADFF